MNGQLDLGANLRSGYLSSRCRGRRSDGSRVRRSGRSIARDRVQAGGAGTDTLRLTGADDVLALQDNVVGGFEVIDLSASGAQQLILSENDVSDLPDTGATLRVLLDFEDTLELTDGEFRLNGSMVADDQFIVQTQSSGGVGQTFLQIAGLGLTNPLDRLDVSADGSVTELDAIRLINALNSGDFYVPGSSGMIATRIQYRCLAYSSDRSSSSPNTSFISSRV